MNIPNLPTDNLYKFMAIFGLIIFLSAVILMETSSHKLHEIDLQTQLAERQIGIDSLIYEIEYMKISNALENHDKTHKDGVNDLELKKASEKYVAKSQQLIKSQLEQYKVNTKYNYQLSKTRDYEVYATVLGISGVILIILGFSFWYNKHQIYIDAEAKWKGVTFVELLNDGEAKKKVLDDEPQESVDKTENEPNQTD